MAATPRARRTRLAPEVRRRQILEIATEHFRARPQQEVSLDEIAREAGVTRALINHHFGTKRELYVEVVRRIVAVNPLPVPEYVQGATPEERLAESLEGWFRYMERNREVWVAAVRSGGMGDTDIVAIVERAREDAVVRLIAVLGLGPSDAVTDDELAMLRGWEAFGEAIVLQHLEYGRITRERACELIVDAGSACAARILARRG